jgi:2-methylcitrate dehydratase
VRNKETADHSSYYVAAIALLYGTVDPQHYREDLYRDPRVTHLMDRVTIEADDERYKPVYPRRIEIRTTDGRQYGEEALHPRGHYRNPMTAGEVKAKFTSMADGLLSPPRQQAVIALTRGLDQAADLSELMAALAIDALPGQRTVASQPGNWPPARDRAGLSSAGWLRRPPWPPLWRRSDRPRC